MPADGEQRETVTRVEAHIEQFSGPIPPPSAMRGYEDVLAGSADRILSMAEREQKLQMTYAMLGLIFGFAAALGLIALSAYVVSLGFAWQSVGIIIGSIAGTAGTFVYGNHSRRQQLREKREAMQNPPSSPELPVGGNDSIQQAK